MGAGEDVCEALSTGDGLGAPPWELASLKPPNQGTWSET